MCPSKIAQLCLGLLVSIRAGLQNMVVDTERGCLCRIPILLFEAFAFTLAARKAWLHVFNSPFRSNTYTMNLLEVILRDSVVYFLWYVFIA